MNHDLSGINEDGMDKLILDIRYYQNRLIHIFQQMTEVMEQTSTYFIGPYGDNVRNRFQIIRSQFPVIQNNLDNYIADLLKVKNQYQNISSDIAIEWEKKTGMISLHEQKRG